MALAQARPVSVRPALTSFAPQQKRSSVSRRAGLSIVRAEGKVVREYREGDDEVKRVPSEQPKALYADENPPPRKDSMSPEMKARLRQEYYGLGGAENVKATNWALYISLFVAALAIASALTGAL